MTDPIDLKKLVRSTRVGDATYTLFPLEIETKKISLISAFVGFVTGSGGGQYRSGAYTKIKFGLAVTHDGVPLSAGQWQVDEGQFLEWVAAQTGQPLQKIRILKLADQTVDTNSGQS